MSQQQANDSKQSCIKKLIGKPNELIHRSFVNKIYPEPWRDTHNLPSCSFILNNKYLPSSKPTLLVTENSTAKQETNNVRVAKAKNMKFNNGEKLSLRQVEQTNSLGKLIYKRGGPHDNWNWQLKPSLKLPLLGRNSQLQQVCEQNNILFDSKFESGNLMKVYNREKSKTYLLVTQNDTNTLGYNQWFYFRAQAHQESQTVRFQIINMRKNYSCFNRGMKIAVFDSAKYRSNNLAWHRAGANIDYSPNGIKVNRESNRTFFSLGWEYTFQQKDEWVYFAYSYPYTFSELKSVVAHTRKNKAEAKWVELSYTTLKNEVYVLQVGDPSVNMKASKPISMNELSKVIKKQPAQKIERSMRYLHVQNSHGKQKKFNTMENQTKNSYNFKGSIQKNIAKSQQKVCQPKKQRQEIMKSPRYEKTSRTRMNSENEQLKDILIIMARVHPGQTPSSFVVEGIIHDLLQNNQNEFRYLKQNLWIHVIPMVNPDGVIHGNNRTSISGSDLNRKWSRPNEFLHTEVIKIKEYYLNLMRKGHRIHSVIDLHAHSKKQNFFLYGCCDRKNYENHSNVKLLNVLLGKSNENFKSEYSSHFVGEDKKTTARVTFYREFQCYSYTIQSSFLGSHQQGYHYSIHDYFQFGHNILISLAHFHKETSKNVLIKQLKTNDMYLSDPELKQAATDHYKNSLKVKSQGNNKQGQEEQRSEGSDSSPSDCNYPQQVLLEAVIGYVSTDYGQKYRIRSENKTPQRKRSLSTQEKHKVSIFRSAQRSVPKQRPKQLRLQPRKRLEVSVEKLPEIKAVQERKQVQENNGFWQFNFKGQKTSLTSRKVRQARQSHLMSN